RYAEASPRDRAEDRQPGGEPEQQAVVRVERRGSHVEERDAQRPAALWQPHRLGLELEQDLVAIGVAPDGGGRIGPDRDERERVLLPAAGQLERAALWAHRRDVEVEPVGAG